MMLVWRVERSPGHPLGGMDIPLDGGSSFGAPMSNGALEGLSPKMKRTPLRGRTGYVRVNARVPSD